MTIERTKENVIFRVKPNLKDENLVRLSNYISYLEATDSMNATEGDAETLSKLIKKGRWNTVKPKYFSDEKNNS